MSRDFVGRADKLEICMWSPNCLFRRRSEISEDRMTHPDFQGAARFWPISMRTFVELPDGGDGAYHDPDDILCPYHDPLSLDVPPYVHALSWPGPLACRCRTHHVVNLFVLYPHAPGHHLAVALASTLPVALPI